VVDFQALFPYYNLKPNFRFFNGFLTTPNERGLLMKINSTFPVGNAAGHCKSVQEVQALASSAATFIVVGSITLEERDGNPGNTWNGDPLFGLNSLGLPNPGLEKLCEIGPKMVHIAHRAGKPILMSVAGSSPEEYQKLCRSAQYIGFTGVELNLGCPNVIVDGSRKKIASFDLSLIRAILENSLSYIDALKPSWFISVKVSPMTDPQQIIDTANILSEFDINAVVTQNTFPNCLDFDDKGKSIIDTPDKTGWAGGSGAAVFQQALGQVSQWRKALPENIGVWGVGGVQSGDDVQKMLWAGASVVQVGTAYFIGGAKIFGDIAGQYLNPN